MLISKQAVQEFMHRQRDDHRWLKAVPARALYADWWRWPLPPQFKTVPWAHQRVSFHLGCTYPQFLFLLDMGAGKTKILLDVISQRQRQQEVKRALVVVPRRLNMQDWSAAAGVHSELEPRLVDCTSIEEKWERLIDGPGDVTVVDYAGLVLACTKKGLVKKGRKTASGRVRDDKKVQALCRRFDLLGLDELHKVRNKDSTWFSVLRVLSHGMPFSYGMTGTLFGKDVEDTWAQCFLIDRGATFGQHLGLFRATFFNTTPGPWGVVHTFRRDRARLLHTMLQHRSIRYEEAEMNDLPPREEITRQLQFSPEARGHYVRCLQGVVNAGGDVQELDTNWTRMRQISSGFLHWQDENGEHEVRFKTQPKLDALVADLAQALEHTKVVVVHEYTTSGALIMARLKAEGIGAVWLYGGTKDVATIKRQFLEDDAVEVLVMNAEAGGTGVDGLQAVARAMLLYESPCSPITRQQVLKRVHRPGQQGSTLIVDYVTHGSVEREILEAVRAGRDLHTEVVSGRTRLG